MLNNIFLFENRVVYEILTKNVVQPDRPQMTTERMRCACWITKATDTQSEYVIFICFSTATMVTEGASLLRLYPKFLSRFSFFGSTFHPICRGLKIFLKNHCVHDSL
jgi:hypothetical protein